MIFNSNRTSESFIRDVLEDKINKIWNYFPPRLFTWPPLTTGTPSHGTLLVFKRPPASNVSLMTWNPFNEVTGSFLTTMFCRNLYFVTASNISLFLKTVSCYESDDTPQRHTHTHTHTSFTFRILWSLIVLKIFNTHTEIPERKCCQWVSIRRPPIDLT